MRKKNFDFFAKEFTLKILMLSLCGMLFSCADIGERDNPVDPGFRGTVESVAVEIVDSLYDHDLPTCKSYNEGEKFYVLDSNEVFFCTGDGWKALNGAENNTPISYGTLKDSRDNQTYKTVTIGTQTWMAENLNYNYNEGSAKSYCYDDKTSNCDKYGRLYTWAAAMDSAAVFSTAGKGCGYGTECKVAELVKGTELVEVRGVCPEGWHLPSDDEWRTLFEFVGGEDVAGTKLKSTSGWNYSGNGVDSFGFAVLPAGYRFSDGDFNYEGYFAYFWCSTEFDSDLAYLWHFYYEGTYVYHHDSGKYDGFSVRCLRDSEDGGSSSTVILSSSSEESSSSVSSSSSAISYGTLKDARDDQTYKTVTIGTQTWMAENLNYDYSEGSAKSYCYDDDEDNCDKYGRLYTWAAAMDVCPEGWHLPSDDEWRTLFEFVGGEDVAGRALKSTSGWNGSGNGTDSFGFAVLSAGYRRNDGGFDGAGGRAYFWSSTESDSDYAYRWYFGYGYARAYHGSNLKYGGFSVRCLRD